MHYGARVEVEKYLKVSNSITYASFVLNMNLL